MNYEFWQKQTDKPLFPEIEWNRPEQKSQAGKLAIVGGNKLSFAAVSMNFMKASGLCAGEVKVLMPDALKRSVPNREGIFFGASTASGGFAKEALLDLKTMGAWADATVLIGDLGKNSETAVLMEEFLQQDGRLVVTRDSADLLMNAARQLMERDETILIVSFAQLQKLFRAVYYPKVLTFSMQLANFVEVLHKFTITYPVTVASFHQDNFVVSSGGKVTTTKLSDTGYSPLTLWSGEVAVKAALYYIWNPTKALEAVTSAIL
jgi:Predicted sugar kinase